MPESNQNKDTEDKECQHPHVALPDLELPDQSRCRKVNASTWTVPLATIPLRYFDVYNSLFEFENYLRMFVYAALKAQYGRGWDLRPVGSRSMEDEPQGESAADTIRSMAKQRIASLRKYSYVGEMSKIPIMYLDFDELAGLTQDMRNRPVFQPILRGAVETFGHKLDEVRVIRNNLAHFRKVTEDDFERLKRDLADIEPAIQDYLREITLDDEHVYSEDEPGLGGLQALSRQLLVGAEHFDIRVSRSRNWIGITLVHSFRQKFRKPRHELQWLWVVAPAFLWFALTKAGVDGSVVCFQSSGYHQGRDYSKPLSGRVNVKYILPWKSPDATPAPEAEPFVRALADLARRLDQDYSHADAVTPRYLERLDAQMVRNAELHPLLSPLCPHVPDIIEDWTGTFDIGLPWVDEEMDRSNEALLEWIAASKTHGGKQ